MKGKIHEESGKQYCFVEVEIEEDTEDAFIASYLRFLGKLRLAHEDIVENGIEGDIRPSKKQLDLLKRLIKEQEKKTGDILRYLGGKRLTRLQDITKEECSEVISMLMPKKEGEE